MGIDGFCELTLEARDIARLESFYAGSTARLGIWSPGEKEFGDEGSRHVHFAFVALRRGP